MITGASHVRVTSSGWYYSRYLVRAFSYIDLVLQDTPLNEPSVEQTLRNLVQEVDNLGDRQEEKRARMEVRFKRVRCFLKYLRNEEHREFNVFDLTRRGGLWAEPFMPRIERQIEREIHWIDRRIQENAERINEDLTWETEDEDELESPELEDEQTDQ